MQAIPHRTRIRAMLLRLAFALAAATALAACQSVADIPLVDGRPNPEPVPGYRVVCDTSVVGYPFNKAHSACRGEVAAPTGRAVIRAKG